MRDVEILIWQWHDEDPEGEGGRPGWYWHDKDGGWWMGPEPSWNVEQYWREAEALGGLCAMRYWNA